MNFRGSVSIVSAASALWVVLSRALLPLDTADIAVAPLQMFRRSDKGKNYMQKSIYMYMYILTEYMYSVYTSGCFQFTEAAYTLRSSAEYSRQCDNLEQQNLSLEDRQHYSTLFGINRRASLHTLRFFDVTSGALIPDIMHDNLEGALPLEVKLILRVSSE